MRVGCPDPSSQVLLAGIIMSKSRNQFHRLHLSAQLIPGHAVEGSRPVSRNVNQIEVNS